MKRYAIIVTTLSVAVFGLALMLWAAEPDWINYDERVVGENSPLYDDVVNRPGKTIWANFLIGHNTDGTHKPIDELASPYTLDTLQFRNNSGVFEMSDDSGSTWEAVGSGGAAAADDPYAITTATTLDATACGDTIFTSANLTLPSITVTGAACRIEIITTSNGISLTPDSAENITGPVGGQPSTGSPMYITYAYTRSIVLPHPDGTGWGIAGAYGDYSASMGE